MTASMRLDGKVAVITGGGSGIGAATSRLFASEGAQVAVLDCVESKAASIAAGIPGALAVPCDITVEDQVRNAMDRIQSQFGRIDILFNCAGVATRHPVSEQDEAGWQRVIDVNLKGAFLCSKHAIRHFPEYGGSIIHTSSVTGITGVRNRSAYSAAKGALVALTRSMALDYAGRGIRVNCVCPGFVRTPFISALLADAERARRLTLLHPLGRLGEPDDIARAVLFLASGESAWMTGQSLVVDGGFSAGHADEI
jgi:NAD(P)-dependent dehydrogenase (short-subunit alcohol dehydrogenase family)